MVVVILRAYGALGEPDAVSQGYSMHVGSPRVYIAGCNDTHLNSCKVGQTTAAKWHSLRGVSPRYISLSSFKTDALTSETTFSYETTVTSCNNTGSSLHICMCVSSTATCFLQVSLKGLLSSMVSTGNNRNRWQPSNE